MVPQRRPKEAHPKARGLLKQAHPMTQEARERPQWAHPMIPQGLPKEGDPTGKALRKQAHRMIPQVFPKQGHPTGREGRHRENPRVARIRERVHWAEEYQQ
jgi:hypothetical protein